MAEAQNSSRTVGSVIRAASVLQIFTESDSPLGVTEIARRLDLSKAVVHRILASFREFELVEFDPKAGKYFLGPGVLRLGRSYLQQIDIREMAREALEHLMEVTGETATYSVRHGWSRVYVDQVTPPREVHMSVTIGETFPLHAGSSSKAFLAYLPVEEQEEYLDQELEAVTAATIVDPVKLREELATIRKRGYARSVGERQQGAASVGAPVFDRAGHPIAVLSVCGPAERFRSEIDRVAGSLVEQTRILSHRLGFD